MGVYESWFASLSGIGNKKKIWLIERFSSAEQIYALDRSELINLKKDQKKFLTEKNIESILNNENRVNIKSLEAYWREKGIRLTTYEMGDYPKKLKNIENPPYQLYYIGKLPKECNMAVAIIGARECTAYGEKMERRIGNECGKNGIEIISGMARGVDGIAQLAGVQAKGYSYGVLGSGVDVCYPAENKRLYELLKTNGGIISEYVRGISPRPNLFPPRNRIISALADAIVVVESREKSGTKITVEMALEQGKDVYVVPGRITDGLSEGCNQLINEGARVITSIDGFINEFLTDQRYLSGVMTYEHKYFANKTEEEIYELIDYQPKNLNMLIDDLEEKHGMAEIMEQLISLEMKGYIKRIGANSYVLSI